MVTAPTSKRPSVLRLKAPCKARSSALSSEPHDTRTGHIAQPNTTRYTLARKQRRNKPIPAQRASRDSPRRDDQTRATSSNTHRPPLAPHTTQPHTAHPSHVAPPVCSPPSPATPQLEAPVRSAGPRWDDHGRGARAPSRRQPAHQHRQPTMPPFAHAAPVASHARTASP